MNFCMCLQALLLVSAFIAVSCNKETDNRFPLAEQYNMDGEKLTRAFDEFKTVEGALSLIVCREGTIVAEEYTNYNMATRSGWGLKTATGITWLWAGEANL